MKSWRAGRTGWRCYSIFFLLLVVAASQACVAGASLGARHTVELSSSHSAPEVSWFAPLIDGDNASLSRWRKSVGPPVLPAPSIDSQAHNALTIVSWNTA